MTKRLLFMYLASPHLMAGVYMGRDIAGRDIAIFGHYNPRRVTDSDGNRARHRTSAEETGEEGG